MKREWHRGAEMSDGEELIHPGVNGSVATVPVVAVGWGEVWDRDISIL